MLVMDRFPLSFSACILAGRDGRLIAAHSCIRRSRDVNAVMPSARGRTRGYNLLERKTPQSNNNQIEREVTVNLVG